MRACLRPAFPRILKALMQELLFYLHDNVPPVCGASEPREDCSLLSVCLVLYIFGYFISDLSFVYFLLFYFLI